jgi:hypothetical protein
MLPSAGLHTGSLARFFPPSNAFPPIARCSPCSSAHNAFRTRHVAGCAGERLGLPRGIVGKIGDLRVADRLQYLSHRRVIARARVVLVLA